MDLQQLLEMIGVGNREPMVDIPNYGQMTIGDFEILKRRLGLPETMKPDEFPKLNPGILGSGMAERAGGAIMQRNNRLRKALSEYE